MFRKPCKLWRLWFYYLQDFSGVDSFNTHLANISYKMVYHRHCKSNYTLLFRESNHCNLCTSGDSDICYIKTYLQLLLNSACIEFSELKGRLLSFILLQVLFDFILYFCRKVFYHIRNQVRNLMTHLILKDYHRRQNLTHKNHQNPNLFLPLQL